VNSIFDDWIYWTSLLRLHAITTVHTFNSWITNPSLLPGSCTSGLLELCVALLSSRKRAATFHFATAATLHLLGVPNRGHRVEQLSHPLPRKRHLRCAGNVCLHCCENNAYRAVAQQQTVPAGRPGYVYQQTVTYAMDSRVRIY
jgi:hypothetical protein